MSHQGVAIGEIARLVGHATTRTTEIVYRRELRPSHRVRRHDDWRRHSHLLLNRARGRG
jgi:hypothetical protein